MTSFLFIYRGGDPEAAGFSPEEMQQYMQKWNEWIKEGMESGKITNPGDALLPGGKTVDANKVVSDGPLPEAKEVVGGYSVIEASDYDSAAEYAKTCPGLLSGGKVEVRQLAGMAPE